MYLDGAHSGWLGWENNIREFTSIVEELPYRKLRGFATNVANYQPLGIQCPWIGNRHRNDFCLNGQNQHHECCWDPCGLSNDWNGSHNELNYVTALGRQFENDTWSPKFIIDTGRNGTPETRTNCSNWCNIRD